MSRSPKNNQSGKESQMNATENICQVYHSHRGIVFTMETPTMFTVIQKRYFFQFYQKRWSPIKNFKCILVCDEGYILDHDHLDDPKFDNPKRARNKIYCMTSKKGHKWKPGNPERFGRCVPDESIHCLNTPNFDEVDFYLTSSRKRFFVVIIKIGANKNILRFVVGV